MKIQKYTLIFFYKKPIVLDAANIKKLLKTKIRIVSIKISSLAFFTLNITLQNNIHTR